MQNLRGLNTTSVIDWQRIETFVGYGNMFAPVVFIGVEEGLSNEGSLQEDLRIRSGFEPVMDLKDAHAGITDTERLFDPRHTKCQRTWRPMCDLMLRRSGEKPTLETRNRYQASELGRKNGHTLLCELLPYPSKNASAWIYPGRFESREAYRKAIVPQRIRLLKNTIGEAKRELIVCYGKGDWKNFEVLFEGAELRNHGRYRVGSSNGTRIVFATHFSAREFNTDAELEALAGAALARL
jgi:hypothetical protein